ncbi:MAG: hypothetical protein MUF38_10755 [Anaerolineae bacterium]|jgi:hypothetical protein|nr:hypothetical protein [Anaerolineae bacterium]
MPRNFPLILLLVVLLAACAPSRADIIAVTALPAHSDPTATPTPPPTPDVTSESAGGFGALVAAANAAPPTTTPLPLENALPLGEARAIAWATDTAMQPVPANRLTFDESPVRLAFGEFYDGYDLRTGLRLSDKLVSLDGQAIILDGYMAPPLKPDLDYFVITRVRLAFCPFCSTAADWPDDIALVYLNEGTITSSEFPLRVTGTLEVGASVDQETGMVSLVRIYADHVERLP